MTRKRQGVFFWIIVALIGGGLILLFWNLVQNQAGLVGIVSFIIGAAIPAISFLYTLIQRHSLRFFILSSRLRTILSYKAPSWNLSARFSGKEIVPETLELVIARLVAGQNKADPIKVRSIDKDTKSLIIPRGPNLEIRYNYPIPSPDVETGGVESASIQVFINNYHVGYREASHAICHQIIPALEAVASVIQEVDAKYSLVIEFDEGQNPFLGLYIAHLPPGAVSSFIINLKVQEHKQGDRVSISHNKVAITTNSQHSLQNLALEFLTFQPSLQERLNRG